MTLIRNHDRMSAIFQLAIVSLTYVREIMLLFGILSLASPIYYASIGLMVLWNLERLFVSGKKDWTQAFFFAFMLIVSVFLVLECRKHEGAVIAAVGRIIIVLYFLNLVRETPGGTIQLLRVNTFWNVLYAGILVVMIFSGFSYNEKGQLVFSYGNPNLTGMSTYICLANLVMGLYVCKPNGERLGVLLAILGCLAGCFVARARTSLMAIGVFLLTAWLLWKTRGTKFNKVLVLAGPIAMLLFPPVWILIYNLIGDPEWMVLGKVVFSYRELIWDYMYEVLLSAPFSINMGQSVIHGNGPHNVPLAIWWDYGILAFICFNALWYLLIDKLNSRIRYSADCVIVAAVISVAVSMTFEVLLFSGGLNFTFRMFYLAVFMNLIQDGKVKMKNLFNLTSLKQEAVLVGTNVSTYLRNLLSGILPA